MQLFRIKNRIKYRDIIEYIKENYIILFILILASILRIITIFSQGWLADEVFHVDYIGKWFLNHFGEYIFQIKHVHYPPSSEFFVNPPFAMWLMTFGMYVAKIFDINMLYGARIINVIFGLLTILLTYNFCKKWYSKKAGIMASSILAFSPIYISNNSSAYLETTLSFFMLLGLYLFFSFLENRNKKYLYFLAIVLGISLITKLLAIPLIGLIILYMLYLSIKERDKYLFVVFMIILILTPMILWAGARDIDQILGVINSANRANTGIYSGLFKDYSGLSVGEVSKGLYYIFMIIGTSVPIVGLLFPIVILYFPLRGINSIILNRRLEEEFKQEFKQLFMVIVLIFSIIFLHYFALMKTTVHRIIFFYPIIVILIVIWLIEKLRELSSKVTFLKGKENHILTTILLLSILSVLMWPPEFYNSYNNFLIGGIQGANRFYRVGDGDGLEIIGKWLNNNTSENEKISITRFRPVLNKYTNRTVFDQPLNYNIDYSLSRGASYLVIHNSHISGGITPKINFSELKPAFIVYVKDIPYIYVYDLKNFSYRDSKHIDIENISDWRILTKDKNNSINISISDSLRIDYKLNKNGWLSINKNLFYNLNKEEDGISIEIFGDRKGENFELDLYKNKSKSYLHTSTNIDWTGWRKFYFAFKGMGSKNGKTNISDIDTIRISISSQKESSQKDVGGTIFVRNSSIIDRY